MASASSHLRKQLEFRDMFKLGILDDSAQMMTDHTILLGVLLFVAASLLLLGLRNPPWSASDRLKPRKSAFARKAKLPTITAWQAVTTTATTYEDLLRDGHRAHGTVFAVEDPLLLSARCPK